MTGFWDSGEVSAAERRERRREEARRRVESGENSPPPPPVAPAVTRARTTRTARAPKIATVDPGSVAGAQYAVWRSVQHFCLRDSLPDATGKNLDLLVAWSDSIQPFRLRPRIVARLDAGAWLPVCYAKDGARDPISQAQAERYRDARVDGAALSGGAQKPLKDTDHPESTLTL